MWDLLVTQQRLIHFDGVNFGAVAGYLFQFGDLTLYDVQNLSVWSGGVNTGEDTQISDQVIACWHVFNSCNSIQRFKLFKINSHCVISLCFEVIGVNCQANVTGGCQRFQCGFFARGVFST